MGNLQSLGIQELTFEEQRALVGGEGWILAILGWAIGGFGAGVVNLGEWIGESLGDFVNGFEAGFAEERGR